MKWILRAFKGLGTDAFVMASVGCRVTLVEENPHLYNLLQQAYEIAQSSAVSVLSECKILKRMSIINADSREYLPSLIEQDRPDVVYLGTEELAMQM
jgi:16S rRNA (guanine1516-N2)-methyltransferase